MMKKLYAVVEIKLKTEVVFECDDEDEIAANHIAGLCALGSLGLQLDESVKDWAVIETDYAHDDAQVTPMYGELPAQKYLSAAFAMQDLLGSNDSGVVINASKSEQAALTKIRELSKVMWEARKEIEGKPDDPVAVFDLDDYDDEIPF